jgi:imidazolonepropionase-like amidohydrolase
MNGDEVIEKGTLVVSGDRITAVGPEASTAVPAQARRVDLSGKTVIPGLIDAHAHLHYATLDVLPGRPWRYLANLAYGITTCHDPSAATHEVFAQAEMVEAGMMPGPRVFSTGFVLYGADGAGKAVIGSLADARHHVRRLKSLGAFTVKSYMQPRREQRQWILKAAREEGMMVVPEGGGDLEMDMTMVLDGHTTIEHALPVAPQRDVVALLGRSRTAYTPTLLVAYGGLSGENWFYQHHEVWKDERLLRYVPRDVVDPRARIRDVMAADEEWHHDDVAAGARSVLREGGMVCLGSHGQLQGLGPHWEIWAFAMAGMSPLECLRVATLHPARALGLDGDLGSLATGKLADFVVLDGNPLARIDATTEIHLVVKNGVAHVPEDLARDAPRERPDR